MTLKGTLDDWLWPLLAHVRGDRHRFWSARMFPDRQGPPGPDAYERRRDG